MRLIGSKKVKSWLIFCCKKPHVDLWKYLNGIGDRLWKYSQRVEDVWKLAPKVEESLMGSTRVVSWLQNAQMSLL